MELKEHLQIINKYKWLVAVIVLVATVAAFLFSFSQPDYYKVSIAFSVKSINRQATSEYQFDGYYAIKASELFSQTIISWFLTPSVLVDIYNQADIDPAITTLERFTSRFKTKQYSAQNFVVIFQERDKVTAEKVASSIISYIETNSENLNQDANLNSIFEVSGSTPVIIGSKTPTWLVTVATFVFALIVSVGLGYLINSLKLEGLSKKHNENRD